MSESFYGMELIGEGRNKWSYSVDGIEDFEEALNRKKQGLSLDGSVIGFLSYETGNGYKPFDLEKEFILKVVPVLPALTVFYTF